MNLPIEEGISQTNIPPTSKARNTQITRKNRNKKPTTREVINIVNNQLKKTKVIKYYETLVIANTMTTTGEFVSLTEITQGFSQLERIADTIWLQNIDISYDVYTANADPVNMARLTIFEWKTSSALSLPTVAQIFNNWSNAFEHAFFNFERRDLYSIKCDHKLNMTGIDTSPTNNSQHFVQKRINLKNLRVDFDQGALTGTNKLYLFLGSDSAVSPYPMINFNCRIWYYDE